MFQRLVFTLATAASLSGLSILYSAAMRPVVVIPIPAPQITEEREFTEAARPAENVRVAATYVPTREWAVKSKYMLRADQAFVYTEKWWPDKDNNKRVHFKPFAMVWVMMDTDGNEQAVSVASDEAQLDFASTFDEKNPSPGRVVRAVLSGLVEITGPDGLRVDGHNFIFDEGGLNLYTTNPVRFGFQAHYGSASQMRMKLIPAEGPPGLDRPHVFGVESIRLIGGTKPVVLIAQMPQGSETRQVKVRCDTDLEYTVATNSAVFSDEVYVITGPKKAQDWLKCDKLTMQFVPKKVDSAASTAESTVPTGGAQPLGNGYQKIERNLELSWLEAEGNVQRNAEGKDEPREQRVKIHSAMHGVEAWMTRLTYDAETQRLWMNSDDPNYDVLLVRKRSELRAPEIEAQMGEPNTLSSLICRGAGELRFVDEKTLRLAFIATWKKQLSKKLDEETQLDLIELDEQAQFLQPERLAGLGADLIKIWLVPMAFGLPAQGHDDDEQRKTPEPEPIRLRALGDVAFQSPQMTIGDPSAKRKTNELDIHFDDKAMQPASVSHRSRANLPPAKLSSINALETRRPPFAVGAATSIKRFESRTPQIGFASVPAVPDGSLGPAVEIPSTSTPEPIAIFADRIEVGLRRIPDRTDPVVSYVHSEGKVTITQARQRGEKPMRLEGDRVDLQTESEKHEIVHVHGTPALIRDRGFEIEGKNIHLDRGANRAWVKGSGRLKLLIPADAKIPGMAANSRKELLVNWEESMEFNGRNAKFFAGVKATLGLGSMRCEQMLVQLVNRVSFQADSLDTQPELLSIDCFEKVRFENSIYLDKKLTDIYRGSVGEFTVSYVTGDVTAKGPGEVHAWQRQKKGDDIAAQDTIQANRPIPVEVTVWNYTGIQFEGKLKGRFDGQKNGQPTHQRAEVNDRVEVIYGPVKLPGETINPDDLPSEAGTIRCGKLRFVNHPVSKQTDVEYRELFAHENTEVEGQVDGQRFTASADEIIYDGSKGLYILRANGHHNARLAGFGSKNSVTGRWIEFNPDPKKRYLKVDRAIEGQGSQ